MNTFISSANPEKSLTKLTDIENTVIAESYVKYLSPDEKKSLLKLAQVCLAGIQEEKIKFIESNKLSNQSLSFYRSIDGFNARKNKVTKNYLIIAKSLSHDMS